MLIFCFVAVLANGLFVESPGYATWTDCQRVALDLERSTVDGGSVLEALGVSVCYARELATN